MKMFVFDIDGTLVGRDYVLKETTIASLNKLVEMGYAVIFASGRCKIGCMRFMKQIANKGNNYLVSSNGAVIYKVDKKCTVLDEHMLVLQDLYDIYNQFSYLNDVFIYAYDKDNLAYIKHHHYLEIEEQSNEMTPLELGSKTLRPMNEKIDKVMIQGQPEIISKIKIPEEFLIKYNIVCSSGWFLEFTAIGADKADGVTFLKKHLKVEDKDVFVFGDSGNDCRMVKENIGIAMGNAYSEVKNVAKYVTKSMDEDGVSYGLKNILHVID